MYLFVHETVLTNSTVYGTLTALGLGIDFSPGEGSDIWDTQGNTFYSSYYGPLGAGDGISINNVAMGQKMYMYGYHYPHENEVMVEITVSQIGSGGKYPGWMQARDENYYYILVNIDFKYGIGELHSQFLSDKPQLAAMLICVTNEDGMDISELTGGRSNPIGLAIKCQ